MSLWVTRAAFRIVRELYFYPRSGKGRGADGECAGSRFRAVMAKSFQRGALTNSVQADWPMDWRASELLI